MGGLVWFFISVYPIYYMIATSLQQKNSFLSGGFWHFPENPTLSNYLGVIQDGIAQYFINSLIVMVACVVILISIALPSAYAIIRIYNKITQRTFLLFLFGLAIPVQAAIIPIYIIITTIGLYDTLIALILPQVAFWLPLSVLIFVTFLRDIPNQLYDSMIVDGAGRIMILLKLVVPLSLPAIVTVSIYIGIQVWNNFLFPLVLTQSKDVRTLPLALQQFQGQYGVNVPGLMAAVVLASLPMIILYLVARRKLLSGLTAGFSK